MSIDAHAETFLGLPVNDYDPDKGIHDPETTAYRVRLDWGDADKGITFAARLAQFLSDPSVGRITAIVIGCWSPESPDTAEPVAEALTSANGKLPNLRGIFFGDIVMEESEISWIQQTDIGPLLEAYPKLEHFRVRGGESLSLGRLDHAGLKTLIIETGGLPVSVVREISNSRLPNLEHLELWLGSDQYGWDGAIDDLQPILSGRLFPKLSYLGLRDCEMADDLAAVIANAPIVRRLRTLDLSLGNMGDNGFRALCMLPRDGALEKLDVHHHFASAEAVRELQRLPFEVDASDVQAPQEWGGEEHRFIAVSE